MLFWAIWGTALVLYGAFSLWYNNWRGPLSAEEVEKYMQRAATKENVEPERLADLRKFLESDDGREFFMVNLIAAYPEPVPMPGTGEKKPAREVLRGYTDHFLPALFRRAGHPAFAGPAAGAYLEHWGVESNPGWTFSGVIRYRSRRDMIELATAPEFDPAHVYKIAAMAHTLAFPVTPAVTLVGPRIWVGLLLALAAALTQLALRGAR